MKMPIKLAAPFILVGAIGVGFVCGSIYDAFTKKELIIKCENGEVFKYYPRNEQIVLVAFRDVVMDEKSNAYEIGSKIYANQVMSKTEGVSWIYNKKDGELRTTFLDDEGDKTKENSTFCKHYILGFGSDEVDPKDNRPPSQA